MVSLSRGARAPCSSGPCHRFGALKRPGIIFALLAALCGGACTRTEAAAERASTRAEPALSYRVVGEGEGPWVVVLHGYGANGDDLVPVASRIARETGARCAVVEAPLSLPGGGRAWWPLDVARLRRERARGENAFAEREPPGLADARRRVISLVSTLRGAARRQPDVYLVGFSQGAMLAADVALHLDPAPAGVAVLSGTFVTVDEWTDRMAERPDLEVLVTHGRSDPVLPFNWASALADAWSTRAHDVRFLAFDGGHTVPREAVAAIVELVREP